MEIVYKHIPCVYNKTVLLTYSQHTARIHLLSGMSRTRITRRGLLLRHISVKVDGPSDDFLSVPESHFLTLLCCCPFQPTPTKPLELQNLFPLRWLDFTCSRNSFSKLSCLATATLRKQMPAYSKLLQVHFNVFFSDLTTV